MLVRIEMAEIDDDFAWALGTQWRRGIQAIHDIGRDRFGARPPATARPGRDHVKQRTGLVDELAGGNTESEVLP